MDNWHLIIAGVLIGIGLMLVGALLSHLVLFQGFKPLWRLVLNT